MSGLCQCQYPGCDNYSFASYWKELAKGYTGSLLFLTTISEFAVILSKMFKTKKLCTIINYVFPPGFKGIQY